MFPSRPLSVGRIADFILKLQAKVARLHLKLDKVSKNDE